MTEPVVCHDGVCKEIKSICSEEKINKEFSQQIENDLMKEQLEPVYEAMYKKKAPARFHY